MALASKLAFVIFALAGSVSAFATTSATEVDLSCESSKVLELVATGSKCTGSIWCSSWEHCVEGVCVPKDAFNRCDAFHSCEFPEQCINGVCVR